MNTDTQKCRRVCLTYAAILQMLGQHIDAALVIDENDHGRLDPAPQNLQQLFALFVFADEEDQLLSAQADGGH
jgi:hypothetical protein